MELVSRLLEDFGPVLIGFILKPAFGLIKRFLPFVDSQNRYVQRALLFGIALGIGWVSQALAVVLPESIDLWTIDTVESLFAGLLAMIIHAVDKEEPTFEV